MFGIGSWEFLFIIGLALLLFGPDKLPDFARTLGRFMRDFRRYQAMMESTIKMEVFASDPKLQKDPFKTGKDFAEKVGSGGFSRPADVKPKAAEAASAAPDAPAPDAPAPETAAPDAPAPTVATESGEEAPEQA
ncbi:MAG: twin-arginine translocase TatA/TatE family subunit [Coriobacteriia bacterium]|nr:twin-arginine translocase TatA/TatE family subunit [Coriobacteriia bacterium]MBN2839951.1 twin-arginine translocase TatA/TatE family subunit [Coriobacteriia bacterium]